MFTYEHEQGVEQQMLDRTYAEERPLLLSEYQDLVLAVVTEAIKDDAFSDGIEAVALEYLPNLTSRLVSSRKGKLKLFVQNNKKHLVKCFEDYLYHIQFDPYSHISGMSSDPRSPWTEEKLRDLAMWRHEYISKNNQTKGWLSYTHRRYVDKYGHIHKVSIGQAVKKYLVDYPVGNRKNIYYPDIGDKMILCAKQGMSLKEIRNTFNVTCSSYIAWWGKKYPEFKDKWLEVRQIVKLRRKRNA